MNRVEAILLHLAVAMVSLSGGALGISKFLLTHDDPFSVAGSWWEPWALDLHVLAAPVFVFAFGYICRRHVLAKLADGRRERWISGLTLAVTVAIAILSGYFLQVSTADAPRRVATVAHLATGSALALAYILHAGSGRSNTVAAPHGDPSRSATLTELLDPQDNP